MATSTVRLLHLSDTHCMHRAIEPLPPADILVHTGDFTNSGSDAEIADFNAWLGELRANFTAIIVIAGNHDMHGPKSILEITATLSNATHVLNDSAASVLGLNFYGVSWRKTQKAADPDTDAAPFEAIPAGVHILLTHGPAFGVFDLMEGSARSWGASVALSSAITRARPAVHLFGHVHEQRGVWRRMVGSPHEFAGGVEYRGLPFGAPARPPPPSDSPLQLISNNAMTNHKWLERTPTQSIAGPARLIVAERTYGGSEWRFQ